MVDFDSIDSLKNNSTKYLWIFDDSCEEICFSKAFVDDAFAGRHRWLSTDYIKHKLFHKSIFGRDVQLQNAFVNCQSLRNLMQVSFLTAKLRIGAQLVDWYRNATSVPYLLTVTNWSTSRHEQTIQYKTVQTPDPLLLNFKSWTV